MVQVTALVAAKRFEFISAGWVQNDEAVTEYHSIVDQMTEGHAWIMHTVSLRAPRARHI